MKKIKVGVIGAYTIDEIKGLKGNKTLLKAGGAPIYSSLGIFVANGEPYVFTAKGKDFVFETPSYIYFEYTTQIDRTLRFEILISDTYRKLILKHKINKLNLNYEDINKVDGIIVNPVCKEIDLSDLKLVNLPIAVDLQGLVRKCEEGKEIEYEKVSVPPNSQYFVLHANSEEYVSSGLTIEDFHELGFKEIIISYGKDGFTVHTKNKVYEIKNEEKGSYEIGNGDFLLGYYFTLRLKGINIEKAIEMAHAMSIKFATYGPNLSFLLT